MARAEPGEILFVDDSARNIAPAKDLGFDVHHFTGPAALRPTLGARRLI